VGLINSDGVLLWDQCIERHEYSQDYLKCKEIYPPLENVRNFNNDPPMIRSQIYGSHAPVGAF
jgi:hypothetical protein